MTQPRRAQTVGDGDLGMFALIVAVIAAAAWFWIQAGPTLEAAARPTIPSVPAAHVGSSPSPAPSPSPTSPSSPLPSLAASPSPSPSPSPVRAAVNVNLLAHPASYFNSEATKVMCADAAIQIVVNVVHAPRTPDRSRAFQNQIATMAAKLTTRADSRDGGWGPIGMAAAVTQLSGVKYELRIYSTRDRAMRASALAIETTHKPVILLAWWGAHSWVMTGFRASADPKLFSNARISGAYILDPWYPRVSSIWGRSDPPGAFQNAAEMVRNYRAWARPEGRYPGRDGKFLAIMPAAAPR